MEDGSHHLNISLSPPGFFFDAHAVSLRSRIFPYEKVILAPPAFVFPDPPTAGIATITDGDGRFAIDAKLGDELVFMALNYELKIVEVDEATLRRNRLVVEVNEKITQLDEVTVSPEDQEEFLRLQMVWRRGHLGLHVGSARRPQGDNGTPHAAHGGGPAADLRPDFFHPGPQTSPG